MLNGLKYADTFSHIIALSAALNIFEYPIGYPGRNVFHEDSVFGDIEVARQSNKNSRYIVDHWKDKTKPMIYMACGKKMY